MIAHLKISHRDPTLDLDVLAPKLRRGLPCKVPTSARVAPRQLARPSALRRDVPLASRLLGIILCLQNLVKPPWRDVFIAEETLVRRGGRTDLGMGLAGRPRGPMAGRPRGFPNPLGPGFLPKSSRCFQSPCAYVFRSLYIVFFGISSRYIWKLKPFRNIPCFRLDSRIHLILP